MSRYLTQRALCHPGLPISRKAARNAARNTPVHLSSDTESFYERLGEDADVRLEPGIDQDEVFDDQFERRAHEIQRTPSASNAVNVIPSKVGPWTGFGGLGIERVFAPDANNLQTILKLDEWGFPQMWTLALGINDFSLVPDPDPIAFDVTAIVQFGSGGVVQTVEIDWLNGTAISLPMNALNVVARYSAQSGEGATSIPADLRLRASLVHGTSFNARPTRTVITVEGDSFIEIPKFAKKVFISSGLSLPGINPFTFYTDGSFLSFSTNENNSSGPNPTYLTSQLVSFVDITNTLVGGPQWLPVPPFARFIRYLDAAGASQPFDAGTVAQFEIGL